MADWYKLSVEAPRTESIAATGSNLPISSSGSVDRSSVANEDLTFSSRRSPLVCRHAAVATSQPLASAIGYDILKQGGNAADAAVAIAAALAVTEPCSTGLGGDMFCLYFDASTRQVSCINGSGRSPALLTRNLIQQAHPLSGSKPDDTSPNDIDSCSFRDSALAVTVHGAAAGWEDLWKRHGSGRHNMSSSFDESNTTASTKPTSTAQAKAFTFAQLLEPAARLAEEGFPVAPITSYHWTAGHAQIVKWCDTSQKEKNDIPLMGLDGQPPAPGDIVVNTDMARVLREFGAQGAVAGFYSNPATGQAIVDAVQRHGGCLTMDDLANHSSDFPTPISVDYHGCRLWQVPPNGQGIAGLIALAGLDHLTKVGDSSDGKASPILAASSIVPGTALTYHAMIEMMRLGFADLRGHVADPNHMKVDYVSELLGPQRIGRRAAELFDINRATVHGSPDAASCTVSFQVVDGSGNAVSFVNSNFQGFGTGIVPTGCGFTLQNRGFGFDLAAGDHPNVVGPNKRPCHTIIPGLLTHADTGELYATLSNMGGHMQPQGHLQLTVNMLNGKMDPQAAIDMPRFCIADGTQGGVVFLEDGVDPNVVHELQENYGHLLRAGIKGHERSIFGRAQIIKRDRKSGVLWAGSDGRADGCAMGF